MAADGGVGEAMTARVVVSTALADVEPRKVFAPALQEEAGVGGVTLGEGDCPAGGGEGGGETAAGAEAVVEGAGVGADGGGGGGAGAAL